MGAGVLELLGRGVENRYVRSGPDQSRTRLLGRRTLRPQAAKQVLSMVADKGNPKRAPDARYPMHVGQYPMHVGQYPMYVGSTRALSAIPEPCRPVPDPCRPVPEPCRQYPNHVGQYPTLRQYPTLVAGTRTMSNLSVHANMTSLAAWSLY